MGAYLSHPITEKCSSDERDDRLKCGASSMQGWRVSQEDAHNCILKLTEDASLFAVYDGHGGKEVAEYAGQKLPELLKELESFKRGDFAEALKEAFLTFDKSLTDPEVVAVLKTIAAEKQPGEVTTDDEDENIGDLREEAAMPLEQLMARYRKGRLAETSEAPASPFLRAKPSNSSEEVPCNDQADTGAVSSSSASVPASSGSSAGSSSASAEPSVSSSSKRGRSRTSLEEKYAGSNGEVSESKNEVDSSEDVVQNGETDKPSKEEKKEDAGEQVSSSVGNGPVEGKGKGKALVKKSPPKKKEAVSDDDLFKKFISTGADDEDDDDDDDSSDDDSGDSDDNFPEVGSSSFGEVDAEADEDGDDEGEEEEDEDEDEEDDEDDEFTMKMTDELVAALEGGRPLQGKDRARDENEDDDGEAEFGSRFLLDALSEKKPGSDSGCTAVVALVLQDRVLVANAGDSRCVACKGGVAVDLSVDHKPEDADELARITKAGGKVTGDGRVNGGLNLSRALGDHVYKQVGELPLQDQMISPLPDIKEMEVTPDVEFLVLACDGIWNFMSSQEVVDFVRPRLQKNPPKLSAICEELFDHCLAPNTMGDGTGCDNMTAVIVQVRRPDEENPIPDTSGVCIQDANKNEPDSGVESSSKRRADTDVDSQPKRTKTEDPDFPTEAP